MKDISLLAVMMTAVLVTALPTSSVLAQSSGPTSVLDSEDVRTDGRRGLDRLYSLDFEGALDAFVAIETAHPGHPIGPFMRSLTVWWEILLDMTDHSRDDQFYSIMQEVIQRCDKILASEPDNVDAIFFKAAAYGFRGRLLSDRGDWFKAARDGRVAMKYVMQLSELDSTNSDYKFGIGIYDYFAEAVPEKYPVVKPLMVLFPKGDKERGLATLQDAADNGFYIQTEATYFLLQIYFVYEKDYEKAYEYAKWLRERYPENAFFHVLEARVLAARGRWRSAELMFTEVLENYHAGRHGYTEAMGEHAMYFLTRVAMGRRDFESALDYLVELEKVGRRTSDPTYYKTLGKLRQGMVYDAIGQREFARVRYREVLSMKDYAGAHDRARRFLEQPFG